MSSITGRPPRKKYDSAGNYDNDSRAGELQIERQRLAAVDRRIATLSGRDTVAHPHTGATSLELRQLENLRTICLERIEKYGGTP